MNLSIPGGRVLIASLAAFALVSCGGGGNTVRSNGAEFEQTAAQELTDTFAATLSSSEPLLSDTSSAQAAGTVVIDRDSRRMTAIVATNDLVASSVHIRPASTDTVAELPIPLIEAPAGSGVWAAVAALSEQQIDALRAGELVFELQSPALSQGVLRGQIVPQLPGTLAGQPLNGATGGSGVPAVGFGTGANAAISYVAALRGEHSVPATPSLAQGSGTATVDPATRQIAAAVLTAGVAPTGVEIRFGAPGVSGPVTLNLRESASAAGVWLARAVLDEQQYNALTNGNLYFNVQSAAYPEGEIRGQLIAQQRGAANNDANAGFGAGTPAPVAGGTGFGAVPSGLGGLGGLGGSAGSVDGGAVPAVGQVGEVGTTGVPGISGPAAPTGFGVAADPADPTFPTSGVPTSGAQGIGTIGTAGPTFGSGGIDATGTGVSDVGTLSGSSGGASGFELPAPGAGFELNEFGAGFDVPSSTGSVGAAPPVADPVAPPAAGAVGTGTGTGMAMTQPGSFGTGATGF